MQLMPLGPGHLTTLQPNAAAEFQKIHAGPLRTSFSLRYLVASEALQCWSSLDVIEIFGLRTLSGCHAEQSPCSMFMYAGLWQQEALQARDMLALLTHITTSHQTSAMVPACAVGTGGRGHEHGRCLLSFAQEGVAPVDETVLSFAWQGRAVH
eukprot:s11225_g1.t1